MFLIGKNLYVPFYNDILIENDTRINKSQIEQIENILINNCTFNNLCDNLRPPLQKSTISEKTSKLSLYYRKMQQSLLFQNIYNFLKKDQILTDF